MKKIKYNFEKTYATKFDDAIRNLEHFNKDVNRELLASITQKVISK
ncbi:hypothetical protein [Flammeovirga sp. EKP202]|nr:hypothetical protein [Flammeovirga sp. EKP202]MBD0403545.1 hypothetical protein [Flammeovirga sp. EKP202]